MQLVSKPFVYGLALATMDLITGTDYAERIKNLLGMLANYAGHPVFVDNATFISERTTGHRNRAMPA